jgi:hypothetical protein
MTKAVGSFSRGMLFLNGSAGAEGLEEAGVDSGAAGAGAPKSNSIGSGLGWEGFMIDSRTTPICNTHDLLGESKFRLSTFQTVKTK